MINPSFSTLEKIHDSRYAITVMISKRARRIVKGSKPLVDTDSEKPVIIALEEIIHGKINFELPKSQGK